MFRARVRLRMTADLLSNSLANLDTAKLKTTALENTRLELRNRFEDLVLDEDASPEEDWQELGDAVSDASQAHVRNRTVAVGTGSLVKRLRWQSKSTW